MSATGSRFKKYSSEDIATLTIARNIGSCRGANWHVTPDFICFGTTEAEGNVYVYKVELLDNLQQALHCMIKSPFNHTLPLSVYYHNANNEDLLVVAYDNGCIVFFNAKSREKLQVIRNCHHLKKIVMVKDYSNKKNETVSNLLLVASSQQGEKGHLQIWKIGCKNPHHRVECSELKLFEMNGQVSNQLYLSNVFLESINKEVNALILPFMDGSFTLFYNLFDNPSNIQQVRFTLSNNISNINSGISSMSFDQDQTNLSDLALCGHYNSNFSVYNLSNSSLQSTTHCNHHKSIECLAFDGLLMSVCLGGSEGSVSIYKLVDKSVSNGNCTKLVKLIENCHDGFVTVIAQNENFFVTGSQDGTIKVLDKTNGDLIANLDQKHTSCITHLEFIEEHLLISSSEDGSIRMHILNIAKLE